MMTQPPKIAVHARIDAGQVEKIDGMAARLKVSRSTMVSMLVTAALSTPEAIGNLLRDGEADES